MRIMTVLKKLFFIGVLVDAIFATIAIAYWLLSLIIQ